MKTKRRILAIVFASLGIALLSAAVFLFCRLTNQPAELIETLSAESRAADYIREKYGDAPPVLSAEAVYSGGFLFDRGRLCGALVSFRDFEVLVLEDKIADNRQYGEIVAAFTEQYLSVREIYADITEQTVSFDFGIRVSSQNYGDFNSLYFDGDISGFLGETDPGLTVTLEGRGFHEKRSETPALLREALEKIRASTEGDLRVYVYVSDPEADLPDMPSEDHADSALRYPPKRYDDYMELIAVGRIDRHELSDDLTVEQPSYYPIDEYTAISDNNVASPITSEQDFFLTPTDYSENRTVYRGIYRYDDRAEENVLTVREDGLYCGVNRKRHDFMLRLDRAHYGITDRTVALRVTPPVAAENPLGKRLYVSFGYDGYDSDENHWYYMDEKYLYLYVPSLCSDLSPFEDGRGVYLAFAEAGEENGAG